MSCNCYQSNEITSGGDGGRLKGAFRLVDDKEFNVIPD